MEGTERFSSRWGLVLASLGMAVGAGNIWRFPRVVSEHGGGAFMLAWLVALFVWSIPLLIIEFHWGRRSRRGPIGAFVDMAGPRWAWAGGFVALCSTAIMFYYAVVSGWCLYYLARSATVGLEAAAVEAVWKDFAGSGWAVLALIVAVGIAVTVVLLGVRRGIERASKILVPLLFLLLVVAALRAVTLPGAETGLARMFEPNFHRLLEHGVWLEAFSQSAWSTGAGWGLLLVYAGYSRNRTHAVSNACITGLGNNAASLLAGFAIVPTLYALLPVNEANAVASAGNEGLGFIWMPRLFLGGRLPGGSILVVVFFAALSVAAISSLIAMVELGVRTLIDLGWSRRPAALAVGAAGILFGLPSALSMAVFKNQDWVWGLGLLVSGALFALGTMIHGSRRMRSEMGRGSSGPGLGWWFDGLVYLGIPCAFLAMLGWWLYQSVSWDPDGWWHPLASTNLGTCLVQWGAALSLLLLFNGWLVRRYARSGGRP